MSAILQLAAFDRTDRFLWAVDLPHMTIADAATIVGVAPDAFIGEFRLTRPQVEAVLAFAPGLTLDASADLQFEIGERALRSDDRLALLPPPPALTPTWTPESWPKQLLLMNACVKRGVEFQWSLGVLYIPLRDIAVVLAVLPDRVRILGFDTFRLEGYGVYPRLDYISDYGAGITVAEAVADIADWPQDRELWVEAVITLVDDADSPARDIDDLEAP